MISAKLIQLDSRSGSDHAQMFEARSVYQAVSEMRDAVRAESRKLAVGYLSRARQRFERWRSKQIQALTAQFELALTQEAEKLYCSTLAKANQDVLELALKISKEFVSLKLASDAQYLAQRVASTLSEVQPAELQVAVNPQQEQTFLHACNQLGLNVNVILDDDLVIGEALVNTRGGLLRIKWQEHFDSLAEQYREQLNALVQEKFRC